MPWPINERPVNIVAVFTSFLPGFRLVDGEDLLDMANLLFSARYDIKASELLDGSSLSTASKWGTAVWGTATWGGIEGAIPIQTYISQVVEGGSVMLPPGIPGRYVQVINDTGSSLQILPNYFNPLIQMADTIAPANSSVQGNFVYQTPSEIAEYICFAPGLWKQSSGGAGGSGGGFPDAPINGVTYGRLNGGWVPVMGLGGGTMTGPLILPPGVPTNPNQAVSLSYVTNVVTNLSIDEGTY